MTMDGLTDKQALFCKEYLVDFIATQAAIRAGYSKKTAKSIAYENLTKPYLQEYLAIMVEEKFEKVEITVELVLKHLYDMAFFDPLELLDEDGDFLPISMWPKGTGKLIAGLDIQTVRDENGKTVTIKRLKIPSRERNIENLGRYRAMFTDKVKDVTDTTQYVHVYVPGFQVDEAVIPENGKNGGNGKPK